MNEALSPSKADLTGIWSRGLRLGVAALVLTGCSQEILITGSVPRSRFDKAFTLVDGDLDLFDQDGVLYNSTTTNSNGRFRVRAPRGEKVFLELGGEHLATATFNGVSGFSSPLIVNGAESPDIYGFNLLELEEWAERFDGCPDFGEGLVVLGEVRANDLVDPTTDEHVIMNRASAELVSVNGNDVYSACFLDDEGLAYDPNATETGQTGMFAIPGVPPGLFTLVVENALPGEFTAQSATSIYVDEATVAPRFPFLMDSGLMNL
ncbi:MAG: hypothetical protein KC912_00255 [Proteobacteria bacterium]|nr:hypothetical protein [Pseudomonadota bacterium]